MDSVRHRSDEPAHNDQRRPPAATTGRPLGGAREKIGMAALAIERARRGTLARIRRSRLLRWRHRSPIADDLLLAPPDLRPPDPSFVDEIEAGGFGLCGFTANLRGASAFDVPPPHELWERELHGFAWLRHCGAGWNLENDGVARQLVAAWIAGRRRHRPIAWAPDVVSRRMISWLSHAALILNNSERRAYAATLLSLEDQVTYLSATWRNAPDGYPRLLALIGLTQSALCIAGHERRLPSAQRALAIELDRQVLADGGHVSRNPREVLELLLDLLPLKQCFAARGITPSPALPSAMDRVLSMLHHLRLGDGQLARFNGMGATERDALATVMAYGREAARPAKLVSPSGYVRLARGPTVVLVDAAPPPPLDLAGSACAGCLSFEVSVGNELLLVNGGVPGPAHDRGTSAARSTASHNTLELGGQSSSRLVRGIGVASGSGAPIHKPDRVTCEVRADNGGLVLSASHDGYAERFGISHSRTLKLTAAGDKLEGIDQLDGESREVRFAWDMPFAIHFHLHPRCRARHHGDNAVEITSPGRARWRLSATGAAPSLEDSIYYAEVAGPAQAQQIVLRAVCYGAAEVRWTLERLA